MPTKKKIKQPSVKKRSKAPSASPKMPRTPKNGALGTYTVARGHVTLGIPTFWTFRQTNDDLQVQSPSGEVSVMVTTYQRNKDVATLNARDYLAHFIESADHHAKVLFDTATKQRAGARYRDHDGNAWYVQFVTNGKILLLAELSCTGSMTGREAKAGMAVIHSLKLKAGAN